MNRLGFEHRVVIHEENFVDPDHPETHTQSIEANWSVIKRMLRKKGQNIQTHVIEYLCEILFRRKHVNVYESLIAQIRDFWEAAE